ncbi:MAG: hypothetical protein LBF08_05210 [Dysgonamonadaceae bacterium]|jgi:predicted RNA-binding protein|nr:hypothetical protein [Dysgonamonadaceae bacterium]
MKKSKLFLITLLLVLGANSFSIPYEEVQGKWVRIGTTAYHLWDFSEDYVVCTLFGEYLGENTIKSQITYIPDGFRFMNKDYEAKVNGDTLSILQGETWFFYTRLDAEKETLMKEREVRFKDKHKEDSKKEVEKTKN